MAQKDRVFQILDLVRAKQKVSVSELSTRFNVTGETIRRDLERLEKEGYVARTYGGAVLIQQPPGHVNYTERAVQNVEAKSRMGELTASILPRSGAIGCDASTTVLSVIPYIRDCAGITILTNSVRILNDFMYDKIRVISTGGNLRSRTQSLQGEAVSRAMEDYFLDLCVLGCRSLDLENGIYEGDEEEAFFKNVMVEHSRRVIIVADHTKFDRTSLIRTLPYEKVDVLVTDQKPSDEWLERMKEENVRVLYPGISFS